MKLSTTEKVAIGAICALLVVFVTSVTVTVQTIKEAGGLSQVLIQLGKEGKHVFEEVAKPTVQPK